MIKIQVVKGAPCGATWEAARRVTGMEVEQAMIRIGLDTQFYCSADPSAWDPMYGHSPVHFAAEVHMAALKKSLKALKY